MRHTDGALRVEGEYGVCWMDRVELGGLNEVASKNERKGARDLKLGIVEDRLARCSNHLEGFLICLGFSVQVCGARAPYHDCERDSEDVSRTSELTSTADRPRYGFLTIFYIFYRMALALSSYSVNVSTFTTVTGPEAQRA